MHWRPASVILTGRDPERRDLVDEDYCTLRPMRKPFDRPSSVLDSQRGHGSIHGQAAIKLLGTSVDGDARRMPETQHIARRNIDRFALEPSPRLTRGSGGGVRFFHPLQLLVLDYCDRKRSDLFKNARAVDYLTFRSAARTRPHGSTCLLTYKF